MKHSATLLAVILLTLAAAGLAALTLNEIRNASPNTWIPVPSSRLDASPVAAPNYLSSSDFDRIRGNGFETLVNAWNSGAYDTQRDRLIIFGGGHNDYQGNEVYAFELATFSWRRLTNPTLNYAQCSDPNSDGTPNSRHTYGGLAYISHADRFFALGGALNCNSGGCGARLTWTLNFAQNRWENRSPSGTLPSTMCDNFCAYDPGTRKVWWFDGDWSNINGLFSYDFDANRWTRHTNDSWARGGCTVDTKRGLLVVCGGTYSQVSSWNIRGGNYQKTVWATTGSKTLESAGTMGFEYDPVADRLVGWDGGGTVYALNPDTKAWTSHTASGAPSRTPTGIYGRFRYVPSVNAFIAVTSVSQNVYFYKFSSGGGTAAETTARPEAPSLCVSPNPFKDHTRLHGAAAYTVTDLRGRTVPASVGPDGFWDTRALSAGVYLISSEGAKGRLTRAVIRLP